MTAIRKAAALIFQNKKLLIVLPRDKPFWIQPGGKYEGNETPLECLCRELKEELQLEVTSCTHYNTYQHEKAAHANAPLVLECYLVVIKGTPIPSSEIERIDWLGKDEFESKKFNVAPTFYQFVPELIRDGLL